MFLNQFDDEKSEFVVGFFKFRKFFSLKKTDFAVLKKITLKISLVFLYTLNLKVKIIDKFGLIK